MKRIIELAKSLWPVRPRKVPFDSSAIAWAQYDRARRSLTLCFRPHKPGGDSRCYQYGSVEPSRYRELLRAESAGRYFNQKIRNTYPYRQLV